MSRMSALLAFGYVLSYEEPGKWETKSPAWDEEDYSYTMKWPDWVVDPDDAASEYEVRLSIYWQRRGYGPDSFEHPTRIETYGAWNWDSQAVLLYVNESKHEAIDDPLAIDEFVFSSTIWSTHLYDSLVALDIEMKESGPKWIIAPSFDM
jgi:hypothetical protein